MLWLPSVLFGGTKLIPRTVSIVPPSRAALRGWTASVVGGSAESTKKKRVTDGSHELPSFTETLRLTLPTVSVIGARQSSCREWTKIALTDTSPKAQSRPRPGGYADAGAKLSPPTATSGGRWLSPKEG
eukprot:4055500-Pleurochrysis_carterae.AAC.1